MKSRNNRKKRLISAKLWLQTYSGNNIVKGYSRKYSVDKLNALKELRMLGIEISESYESQLLNSIKGLKQQRLLMKEKREEKLKIIFEVESDENFSFIIGRTSGGFPYGLTQEEMFESQKED